MVRFMTAFISFSIITLRLSAQCDDFTVYHSIGEVIIKQGSLLTPVKKNMKIKPGAILQIGEKSSVILLTGNDKALKLSQPAILTYSGLSANCQKNQSSLTHEYLKYVGQSIIEKEEPQTAMVIKGAVYRTRAEFSNSLMRLPADSSVITSDSVRFAWRSPVESTPRYLLIFENGVKLVYSSQMTDTTVTLPNREFKPGTIYFWLVSSSDTPADNEPRFTFVHGTSSWQNTVLDQWTKTLKELEGEVDDVQKKLDSKKENH